MEDNNKNIEEETEDDDEEEEQVKEEEWEKEKVTSSSETEENQKDLPSVIVPTINIREERLVDLAKTPAFLCLHEVRSLSEKSEMPALALPPTGQNKG